MIAKGAILDCIPAALRMRNQWVLWCEETRDGKPTKIPYQVNGARASSSDSATWNTFGEVVQVFQSGGYTGIGFVFGDDDGLIGIDLDGCRNPVTEELAEWACIILDNLDSYAEVSPSGTGVKIFGRGKNPLLKGKNWKINAEKIDGCDKEPGVEIYDSGRYFAVTGELVPASPMTLNDVQAEVEGLCDRFAPGWRIPPEPLKTTGSTNGHHANGFQLQRNLTRVAKYLDATPGAISGSGGHNTAFAVACKLVLGFDLSPDEAFPYFAEWNQKCEPPWSEWELRHKLEDADKEEGERGYLWDAIQEPARINCGIPAVGVLSNDKTDELFISEKSPADDGALSNDKVDEPSEAAVHKPEVILPGGSVPISQTGEQLGKLLSATGEYFKRGESVTKLAKDDDGEPVLRAVRNASFPSAFETVATLCKVRQRGEDLVQERATCSKSSAETIVASDAFHDALPPIKLLTRTPVLAERDGRLVQIVGYDRELAVYAAGKRADDVPLVEAVDLLKDLLQDFRFATPSDKSRAMAATITPALLQSNLLGGRAPVDLGEADKSQTGKGYRNKITAAIYGDKVKTVTQRKGGVGSLEETFNSRLIAGDSLISFENIRGKIDSPSIESFLTEDNYPARQPYCGIVSIDPRRIVVMMTSNKAEFTRDFANRSSCVRLKKQPAGYQFQRYAEGNLLDHVHTHQPRYLGAVFSVVRKWWNSGKPRTDETRHDFREWAQVLDWIVQNIFGMAPLLDGHQEAMERTTKPVLNWLRDVTLAVEDAGQTHLWLRTNNILDILCDSPDVEIPGISEDADTEDVGVRETALKAIGRKLGQCFRDDRVEIDGYVIERNETFDEHARTRKEYRFRHSET